MKVTDYCRLKGISLFVLRSIGSFLPFCFQMFSYPFIFNNIYKLIFQINTQICFQDKIVSYNLSLKKLKMSIKTPGYNGQQIKNQIQNLTHTRESIQKSKDVSGSMVKLAQTMNNLKPLMNKQNDYIKTFLQNQATSGNSSQQSEIRRYVNRIFDISVNQIQLLLYEGQKYFTVDIKRNWKKIATQIEKQMFTEKQKIQNTNPTEIIEFMFKVMNLKDKLFKDFLKSVIYRKLLLCKDLSIEESGYVHSEKKAINKLIETYELSKNYVPHRPLFDEIDFIKDGTEGSWGLNLSQGQTSSIAEILKIMTLEVQQVFSIIRNYANLNYQQRNKEDIKRNDNQVTSLREKIDQLQKSYQILEKKYREAISKDQKLDVMELKQKLKQAEEDLEAKELQIKHLNYEFRDSSTQMQSLKEKVSELTLDLQKLTKQELVKLKDLQNVQKNLGLQFTRLYQNIKSFGNIFEFENDGKKQLAQEIVASKNTIQKMAGMLGRQKQKNRDLQQQITRLNQIILELGKRIKMKRLEESSLN